MSIPAQSPKGSKKAKSVLAEDLGIIWRHFVRMAVYVACEGSIFLAFRWNPFGFSIQLVCLVEKVLAFFMVATIGLFTITAFLLLVRSSLRELFGWPKKPPEEWQQ